MMAEDPTMGSDGQGTPGKKRRVPVPRKKSDQSSDSGQRRVPARRSPGKSEEVVPEPTAPAESSPAAIDPAAQQQAAAQESAAQESAAQEAAQKAAAQKAAAQAAAQKAAAQAAAQKAAAQAAAQKAAAQAAAQKAAAQKAAAQKAAAQKAAAAQQPSSPQLAAKKAAALQAAQQAAARQQAAAKRPGGAPPAGAAAKRPGRKMAPSRRSVRRPSAAAAVSGDGTPGDMPPPKSRMPIYIFGGLGVVLVVGLALIFFKDPPQPPAVEPEVVKRPQVDHKKLREDSARMALDRVEKTNSEDPTDWVGAANRLGSVINEYADTEVSKEAGSLREQLLNRWRSSADQAWSSLKGDVRGAFADGEFATAARLLEKLPKVFEGSEAVLTGAFENELDNLRKDAREQLRYKKRLDELSTRAGKYARMGYEDIAIAIIEALPEKVEDEAPDVWRIKNELVKTIQREGLEMLLNREEAAEQELVEARRLEAERKKAERERRWIELRDSVPWTPLLARSNLYNWVATSDRQMLNRGQSPEWRILEREGVGVMVGDNRSGRDMYTGVFSNHWEDFVCEFEVSLKSGALRISPRSLSNTQTGVISEQTSPMLDLGDDFPKNRWVKVTMEVHGDSVTLRHGPGGTEMTLDPETTRLPSTGGFVFWIADGTRVEIRDVRVKLVSDTRDGGIFAK
ncbi:MAG: hypothetical protein VX764_05240 [Planctomycetota bacterium]|nr:hypothetical protein [Planctomycetota bacterium]